MIEARYEIICGHRRAEAAKLAGLLEVPVIVREMTDAEAAEIALVDNLQREDVGALEEAEAFGALLELHGTVEAVAARVGKDVPHVAKRLKLMSLGAWQRDSLRAKLISECVGAAQDWPDFTQRRGVIIGLEHALRICEEADKEYRE